MLKLKYTVIFYISFFSLKLFSSESTQQKTLEERQTKPINQSLSLSNLLATAGKQRETQELVKSYKFYNYAKKTTRNIYVGKIPEQVKLFEKILTDEK